jgi:protein-L-isoaspartate(D-aspartate) O-methyltransferase
MSVDFEAERKRMIETQIRARGVRDPGVLAAMEKVPRHLFVPEELRAYSHADEPLPIGDGQTISQPYIVAYMTEALGLRGRERVLEIGTGSGYQTAVLAEVAAEVYTVELIPDLASRARRTLDELGCRNVRFKIGDGTGGWPEFAPFDAVLVTAAAARIPPALEDQLGRGGRLVCPVGTGFQELVRLQKRRRTMKRERLLAVRFVPLITTH